MNTAPELLRTYLAGVQSPAATAALFAPDGVLELPWVGTRAQGPEAIERLITGLLGKVPGFGFKNIRFWIETPDRTFAEYAVEAAMAVGGKVYRQTYAGLLISENGKIKLLREALDTKAAEMLHAG
jgi:ketosteroid isomerase-like protein